LINSINFITRKHIDDELNDCVCFSWQIDETTDVSCFAQLSVTFRYVQSGKIVERFMGFFNVSEGRTANDLFSLLKNLFEKYHLTEKLVGQTYDGACYKLLII